MSSSSPLFVSRNNPCGLDRRFMSKVLVDPNTACWLWLAHCDQYGYGVFSIRGRTLGAHRVAWEMTHGPIPPGMVLDHICRVRRCVNIQHLRVVGRGENTIFNSTSPSALNKIKALCHRGHAFDEDNTHRRPDGARVCRACHREWKREWRAQRHGVRDE